jgi:acyl-CoA synthetase (AMP-forming)/AMP-acid ligase II
MASRRSPAGSRPWPTCSRRPRSATAITTRTWRVASGSGSPNGCERRWAWPQLSPTAVSAAATLSPCDCPRRSTSPFATPPSPALGRREPELTDEVLTPDGWLTSGDLGYFDRDGNLVLVGRATDLYIRGGYNVYPLEVENVLAEHPGVDKVAVVGVPAPVIGEIGVAFVVPVDGIHPPSTAELRAWTCRHLADYKAPDRVELVGEPTAHSDAQGRQGCPEGARHGVSVAQRVTSSTAGEVPVRLGRQRFHLLAMFEQGDQTMAHVVASRLVAGHQRRDREPSSSGPVRRWTSGGRGQGRQGR